MNFVSIFVVVVAVLKEGSFDSAPLFSICISNLRKKKLLVKALSVCGQANSQPSSVSMGMEKFNTLLLNSFVQ